MNCRIEVLQPQMLVGKHLTMSLSENRSSELWRCFMPQRKEIKNTLSADLFSLQVYDDSYNFSEFNTNATFKKWAAVEVSDFDAVPDGMEPLTLTGGLYAVFEYKGASSQGAAAFRYIFGTWLPNSDYVLDGRPHFEILGEKYKNDDPTSEEEIWIPIKFKG
nr:GyrI-like domain-containing protein [uncultured Acetobacteroides sp.]